MLRSSAVEDVVHERCGWRFERGSPVRCGQQDLFSAFASGHWPVKFVFSLCIWTPATRKLRKRCRRLLDWVSWRFFSTRSASLERTRHLRCLIATSTLKGSLCRKQHLHVYVKEEEWGLFVDSSLMEKRTYSRSFCTHISWRLKSRGSLVQRRLSSLFCFSSSPP